MYTNYKPYFNIGEQLKDIIFFNFVPRFPFGGKPKVRGLEASDMSLSLDETHVYQA